MFFILYLLVLYFNIPMVSFEEHHIIIRFLSIGLILLSIQLSLLTYFSLRKAHIIPYPLLTKVHERMLNPTAYVINGILVICTLLPTPIFSSLSHLIILSLAATFDLISIRLCTLYRFSRRKFWLSRYNRKWKHIHSLSNIAQTETLVGLMLDVVQTHLSNNDHQGAIEWIKEAKRSSAQMIQSFNDKVISQEEHSQIASYLAVKLSKAFSSLSLIESLEKHEAAIIEVLNYFQQLTISLSSLAANVSHIPLQEAILFTENIQGPYIDESQEALACIFEHASGAFIHNPYILGTEKSVNLKIIIQWLKEYGQNALKKDTQADIGPFTAPFEKMIIELKEIQKGPVELLSIIDLIEEALLFFNQLKLAQTQRQSYESYMAESGRQSDIQPNDKPDQNKGIGASNQTSS